MTATTAPPIDRSDVRHVLVSGTKVGLGVAAGIALLLAVGRFVPAGVVRVALDTLIVLAIGVIAGLLPGRWVAPRSTDGVAAAAAIGLWGTVVFSAVDIIVLRNVRAYPWTWDAIGGGSTWWYLPIWWMLGTFLAWMGGLRAAGQGEVPAVRVALPVVIGAVAIAAAARVTGCPVGFPITAGAGFAVTLIALALVAQARSS